jgi:hypothetical protein
MTDEKKVPGKPFVKGDPRCWRKGKPKEFNALRDLAQAISQEVAVGRDKETGVTSDIIIAGHRVTVAEKILRDWARSGDWQRQKGFMEIAFGKVPDKVEMTGKDGAPLVPKGTGFDYAGFAADFAARFAGAGVATADGAGEPLDTAHADAEAGDLPGAANP